MEKLLERPLIFIGTGRSGTTIISEIVMRHPHLAYPSNYQKWFPFFPQINLLRFLFENRFWNFRGQKKQLNQIKFLNKLSFYPIENYKWWSLITKGKVDMSRDFLLNREVSVEEKQYIRKYFRNLVKYQGKRRLSLKITGPSRIKFFKSIFPDAIFIKVERKDLSTIKSFLKVPFWKSRGGSQIWWRGAYSSKEKQLLEEHKRNPVFLTAFQVKKIKQVTDYEIQTLRPSVINISYEEFTQDPKNEVSKILSFCGLQKDSHECFNYIDKLKIVNRNLFKDTFFSRNDLEMINNIKMEELNFEK